MRNRLDPLDLILVLSITFLLISDATASKIVSLFGVPVNISVLYFPITYVLADILTEVYGYAVARRIIWMTILCSVLSGSVYQLAAYMPLAFPDPNGVDPYHQVFSIVPRIMIAGWIAVFCGDLSNNYILAKMKIWCRGKHFWARAITSTAIGQGVNTVLFVLLGLSGTVPMAVLPKMMLCGWAFKVAVEIILLPVTYYVVAKLKKIEGTEVYDTDTRFSPLIFR